MESQNDQIRPSWDAYFKKISLVTRERSPCERLKVGCLLVKENRIISQGYNGFLPGCPHQSILRDNHEQATVHAEQNAVADCAKRGVNCFVQQPYYTLSMYYMLSYIISIWDKKIKYIEDYKNDPLVLILSQQCQVNIEKYNNIINFIFILYFSLYRLCDKFIMLCFIFVKKIFNITLLNDGDIKNFVLQLILLFKS